jgi:hypothetical protein
MRLLARWFDASEPRGLATHPRLQLVAVCAVAFAHGPWQAMELLARSAAPLVPTRSCARMSTASGRCCLR